MLRLQDLIPDESTRAFIGQVYRRWGEDWAAVLTRDLHSGDLIDMGHEDFYPCPDPPGINIANRPCHRCGKVKPEGETCKKYTDRCWRDESDKTPLNPRQLAFGEKVQLQMEVR